MNITELDSYQLVDPVQFNDKLNPLLFDGQTLRPEIRNHLIEIARDFQSFLGVTGFELKDITISGSNAAYSYTSRSDLDLHLVVDLPQADQSTVFRELFDAKKYQYNDQYNITIRGIPVELYVQNANVKHVSQGIYSVLNNDWVSIPKRQAPAVDDISVRSKVETLIARSVDALRSKNKKTIDALLEKMSAMRRAGLEQGGEFSPENLAYKTLRANGVIDRLYARKNAAKSNELSLESSKTPAEYGWVGDAVAEEVLPDVKTLGVNAIAKKHRVSLEAIRKQLARGIKVELEHTTDTKLAREIALDHLAEMPDYYSRLARMEKGAVKEATDALAPRELAAQFRAQIAARYPGVVVDLFAATHGGLHLSKIEIPKDKRKLGMATEILKGIAALADKNRLVVSLSPTNEFGTPKTVLVEFYKRFGFVFNRGRNKDFRVSETMYREPRSLAECAGRITPQNQTADVGPNEIKRQAAKFGNVVDRDGYPARKMTDRAVTESLEPGVKEIAQQWAAFQKTSAAESVTPEIYPIRDFPIYGADGIVDGMASVERHLLLSEGINIADDLFEANMSPGVLKQWAQSSAAQGIRLGFEAELVFPGYGGGEGQTYEDDDAWNETPVESLDQINSMFPSNYDDRYRLDRALRTLDDEYTRYIEEVRHEEANEQAPDLYFEYKRDEDWAEFRDDWIREQAVADGLDESEVEEMIEFKDGEGYDEYVSQAKDAFEAKIIGEINSNSAEYRDFFNQHKYQVSHDEFGEWAANEGYETMRDIMRHFRLDYPSLGEGTGTEYTEAEAERLALDLGRLTGVDYIVLSGYHAETKDIDKWYIESDGSISIPESLTHAMPVEIVSPAMPLDQALDAMSLFFNSVRRMGAISNRSTGFHMSLSINEGPLANKQPNYLKLVLFTGDEYVLDQFSRASNAYAKSASAQLAQLDPLDTTRATQIMELFRKGLTELAANAFVQVNATRYSAVNMKGNYVEFRAAGGANYSDNVNKLIQTAYRYAYAYAIAVDPNAYRTEFAKKLYKFISDFRLPIHSDTVQLFANYAVDKNVAALKQGLNMYRGYRNNQHQANTSSLAQLMFGTAINILTTYTNHWRSRGQWRPDDDEALKSILEQWKAAATTSSAGAAQTIIRDLNALVALQVLEQQTMRLLRDEIFDEFNAAAREQGLIQQ